MKTREKNVVKISKFMSAILPLYHSNDDNALHLGRNKIKIYKKKKTKKQTQDRQCSGRQRDRHCAKKPTIVKLTVLFVC